MFNNLIELIKSMPNEQDCREYIANQRWDNGKAVCPYCGFTKCYVIEMVKDINAAIRSVLKSLVLQ